MAGIAGQGERVLFLTGTGADLRKPKTPLNSILVDDFNVLSFDQRGMGQSDKPDYPYSMLDYAKDAIAVMDAFDWDRAHIVGYSFGGMVAQEIAIGWPERIERLALIATTAGGAGGASYPVHNLEDLAPEARARRSLEIMDLFFSFDWQVENPKQAGQRLAMQIANQAQFADEPGYAIGRSRQLAARANHNCFERLSGIKAHTLVLAGKSDGQAPIAAQQAMATKIKSSVFMAIDGSHSMLWDNPQTLEHVRDFFQQPQSS